MAGAEPYFVNSQEDENFKQTSIVYPRKFGKTASSLYFVRHLIQQVIVLKRASTKIDRKGNFLRFLICSDECYVDIYESSTEPPIGILECEDITLPKSKSVVFHSLSKRSNLGV